MSAWTEKEIKGLLERALSRLGDIQGEAILSGGRCSVSRFANNRFHQTVRENRHQLYLRGVDKNRTLAVVTDDFSDEALGRAASRLKEGLPLTAPSEDLLPLLSQQKYQSSAGRVDSDFDKLDIHGWMDDFRRFFSECEQLGYEAAGKWERTSGTIGDYGELSPLAMANTSGLFTYSPATSYDFSTTVYAGHSSGWAGSSARKFEYLDLKAYFKRALAKAQANTNTQALSPGRYTVILEPAAWMELLRYVTESFNALSVSEGRSFVQGKIGEKVFPEWFSLSDDAYHPQIGGAPFDGEGVPVKALPLVDKGTIKNIVTTRALAKKMGMPETGHGNYLPNPYGAYPRNVVMSGGTTSLDKMIASTPKGILVTRIWYTTPVDEKKLIITGMTRDGTFLIENGKIVGAVRNLRFNECIPSLLQRVDEIGKPELTFGTLVPPLRVRDFHFTSQTEF
jgi:PmbA protein